MLPVLDTYLRTGFLGSVTFTVSISLIAIGLAVGGESSWRIMSFARSTSSSLPVIIMRPVLVVLMSLSRSERPKIGATSLGSANCNCTVSVIISPSTGDASRGGIALGAAGEVVTEGVFADITTTSPSSLYAQPTAL